MRRSSDLLTVHPIELYSRRFHVTSGNLGSGSVVAADNSLDPSSGLSLYRKGANAQPVMPTGQRPSPPSPDVWSHWGIQAKANQCVISQDLWDKYKNLSFNAQELAQMGTPFIYELMLYWVDGGFYGQSLPWIQKMRDAAQIMGPSTWACLGKGAVPQIGTELNNICRDQIASGGYVGSHPGVFPFWDSYVGEVGKARAFSTCSDLYGAAADPSSYKPITQADPQPIVQKQPGQGKSAGQKLTIISGHQNVNARDQPSASGNVICQFSDYDNCEFTQIGDSVQDGSGVWWDHVTWIWDDNTQGTGWISDYYLDTSEFQTGQNQNAKSTPSASKQSAVSQANQNTGYNANQVNQFQPLTTAQIGKTPAQIPGTVITPGIGVTPGTQPMVNQGVPPTPSAALPTTPTDNTLLYVGVGAVAFLVIVGIIVALRKKNHEDKNHDDDRRDD